MGSRQRYFENGRALIELLGGGETAASALHDGEAELRARGWAMVQALQPQDFVGTQGQGEEARDVYHLRPAGPRRAAGDRAGDLGDRPGAGPGLRIALLPYRFDGQPEILLITISPLPEAD